MLAIVPIQQSVVRRSSDFFITSAFKRGSRGAASTSKKSGDRLSRVTSGYRDVEIAQQNISQHIWQYTERLTALPALTDGVTDASYTFREARVLTHRLNAALPDALGLRSEDTLGVVMPNSPEFAFTFLAAVEAGVIVSPANPLYTAEELAYQLGNASARHVVTTPGLLSKVRAAVELIPGGAQVVVATDGSGAQEAAVAKDGLPSLHELMKREPRRKAEVLPPPDPEALAILPYSSGTTGLPKGVRLTHRNIVANLCQSNIPEILGVMLKPGQKQEVALAVLPWFHIYGLTVVLLSNFVIGRRTVSVPRFEPLTFASAFKKYQPSVISVVPPLLLHLTQTNTLGPDDLRCLRFVMSGAASCTRPVIEAFLKRVDNPDLKWKEGYGMTETSPITIFRPPEMGLDKLESCGTVVPKTEAKITNEAGGVVVRREEGELLLRGPQVMQGYHNNEEATRETLTEDGWLKTGDLAFIDEEDHIHIVGRIKELIKVKGFQVSPTELETVLRKLEGIADVAVVGMPDERAGEVPKAFVVKSPGSTITEDTVAAFLEERVAPFKRLAGGVRFVDVIPKSAAGKILRKELKKM